MGRIGRMIMSNPLPERIKALLESDPYAGVLGLSVSIIDGAIQTKSETSHSLVGNINLPALHGGVVGSLMMLTASLNCTISWIAIRQPCCSTWMWTTFVAVG